MENKAQLFGSGIDGVKMVFSLVTCNAEKSEYKGPKLIHVILGDENKFKLSTQFVPSDRGLRTKVLSVFKKKNLLFVVCHFTSAENVKHDENTYNEYMRLTKGLLDTPAPGSSL